MKPSIDLLVGSNICVVTAYDDAFAEVGDFTTTVKISYCLKHKYDFRVYREGFDQSRHPSWSKLLFIREVLKEYEWVFWIDADAVFTNDTKRIESVIMLGGDIFICKEHIAGNIFNLGVFMIRRSDWAFEFIEKMWGTDRWWKDGYWEQSQFMELMRLNYLGQRVVYFPMRQFNSMVILEEKICCGNRKSLTNVVDIERAWQQGDFVAHRLSGSVGDKKRDLEDCLVKSGWKMGV